MQLRAKTHICFQTRENKTINSQEKGQIKPVSLYQQWEAAIRSELGEACYEQTLNKEEDGVQNDRSPQTLNKEEDGVQSPYSILLCPFKSVSYLDIQGEVIEELPYQPLAVEIEGDILPDEYLQVKLLQI